MSYKIGFALALLTTVALALAPLTPIIPEAVLDKLQHFVAFFVLTSLALLAWGLKRVLLIAGTLATLGAGIEMVQGLPIIGRGRQLLDWVADLGGILVAILLGFLRQSHSSRASQ